MREELTCTSVAERNLIERYVTGTAAPDEVEAFENHFLQCARCQEDVRIAAAIRASLAAVPAEQRRGSGRRLIWVALAAAAGLTGILFLSHEPRGEDTAELGRVMEPPAYLGIAVRGPADAADSLFEAGMASYVAGRYGDAITSLTAAVAAGVDSLPALFYRSASFLMSDRPDDALTGYTSVVALGDSPYLAEAHFYRAKALLQLGRPRDALVDLAAAGATGGPIGGQAQALADSVRQWRER